MEFDFKPRRATSQCAGLAVGLGLAVSATCAGAQEAPIVVRGRAPIATALDKVPTPLVDTPQAISIVSAEEMRDRGVTSMTDAVRVVPGISLGAGETSWQGNNLVLRGFTTRNDTFLDGLRDYGYYFRDPFNSESIEVLKGPSSVLFGRGATGGVIHQVSKRPTPSGAADAELAAGTDETLRATIDYDAPLNDNTAVRVAAMAHRSEVAARDGALYQRWGAAPSIAFGLSTPTRLYLSYLHQEENNRPDYGIPWFNGAPAQVDRKTFYGFDSDYLDTNVNMATARLEHDLTDRIQVRDQLRYSRDQRRFRTSEAVIPAGTPATSPLSAIIVTRNEFSGYSTDTFLQNQTDLSAHFGLVGIDHELVAGVEFGREQPEPTYIFHEGVIGTKLVDPPPQVFAETRQYVRLRAKTRADTIGVYAIDTLHFTKKWLAVIGLRWDRFDAQYHSTGFTNTGAVAAVTDVDRVDEGVSGRGSVVFKPTFASSLYVSYANSFNPSAEGIESLVSAGRSVAQANLNADPEKGRIIEAGAKWSPANEKILLSGSVFEIVKSNVRIPDPAVTGFNTNGGEQRVRGVELEALGRVTARLTTHASYAYLDSETTKSVNPTAAGSPRIGEQLTITPRHSASVQASYAITDRLEIGGDLVYQASRLGQNTNASLLRAPGYAVLGARVAYRINDHITLQLNGFNLTDELYYDQVHPFHVVPGAGRSALVSLRVVR